MLSLAGEGTRTAALRWLMHLRFADIPHVRVLFTHHPRYGDLTPHQYADALAWLRRMDLVDGGRHPTVSVGADEVADSLEAAAVPRVV